MKARKSTTGIVLRHAGSTIATMSRTQGSVSLSSAEAEHKRTVSEQVQEILGEYHEHTHIIPVTGSSAAKANAERPGCGRMKNISAKYKILARRDHEPRSYGCEEQARNTMLPTA